MIGKDYPWPIVDDKLASRKNMDRMASAFAASKAGKSSLAAATGSGSGKSVSAGGSSAAPAPTPSQKKRQRR